MTQERIAEARCKIDMARLLTLKAAWLMDVAGNKVAKTEIAMIKVVAPSMACQVIDWAMQAHGGGGMCDDFPWPTPTPVRAPALCRRPGRSAPQRHRQVGAGQVWQLRPRRGRAHHTRRLRHIGCQRQIRREVHDLHFPGVSKFGWQAPGLGRIVARYLWKSP